jgi:hypothetical protein
MLASRHERVNQRTRPLGATPSPSSASSSPPNFGVMPRGRTCGTRLDRGWHRRARTYRRPRARPPVIPWGDEHAPHRMFATFEAERVDGFLARGPHLLAVHERSFRDRRFADRLVVFDNGVLEHRVTYSDAPDLPNGDDPDPQIRLERVPLATLTGLRDALAAPALANVRSHGEMDVASVHGTSHMFAHAGTVPRIRLEPDDVPHADLQPLLAALSQLRERFPAPPDEA